MLPAGVRTLSARHLLRAGCRMPPPGAPIRNRCRRLLAAAAAAPPGAPLPLPGVSWGLAYPDLPAGPPVDHLDGIVVLAGGQTEGAGVPPWVARRLDAALDLFALQRSPARCRVLLLGGGTPHKPPYLDVRGHVVHESTSCAHYLLARGVLPRALLKEVSSYDTVGNAFFSLTIHALPAGWRRLAVVTSDFHMPRTAALFRDMYGLAGRELYGQPDRFQLLFVGASDEGLFAGEVLAARQAKEAQALASWRDTSAQLASLPDLHDWLHQTHLCYAVSRQQEFGVPTITDAKVLASY